MADRWLVCMRCGSEFALGPYFLGCPNCVGAASGGAALEVRYDLAAAKRELAIGSLDDVRTDLLRFSPLLPSPIPRAGGHAGRRGDPPSRVRRFNERDRAPQSDVEEREPESDLVIQGSLQCGRRVRRTGDWVSKRSRRRRPGTMGRLPPPTPLRPACDARFSCRMKRLSCFAI